MDTVPVAVREIGERAAIQSLSNDAVIIELLQTVNHLSRWLTPIHDRTLLEYSVRRSEPSVKDLLITMRDTETWVYTYMHAIATRNDPDLDSIPPVTPTPLQLAADRQADPLVIMSGFRRVRQSTTSLLRALPDTAWERGGHSRQHRNWTIRELAEHLLASDRGRLNEIDVALERSGARQGIAEVSQVRFAQINQPFPAPGTRVAE
jgi:hypothetical protein